MIEIDTLHKIRNGLTEYKKNFTQINPFLHECYLTICPPYEAKLAGIMLNRILMTKRYSDLAASKKAGDERNRIYSDIDMSLETLSRACNSTKYIKGKSADNDRSNMIKRIKWLHDKNVFYHWKSGKMYIFIMERDFGTWKVFNSKGYVIPKSMLKILNASGYMIDCMIHLVNNDNKAHAIEIPAKRERVERDFEEFIKGMIQKMNPIVTRDIESRKEDENLEQYLNGLKKTMRKMDDYEGLVMADDFLERLPPSIQWKFKDEIKKEMAKMNTSDLEKELVPDNPNMIKSKKVKTSHPKKKTHVKSQVENPGEGIRATMFTFDRSVDPFRNARDFVRYYYARIRDYDEKARFENFGVDACDATRLLDLMTEEGRDTKTFLDAWIKYFIEWKLKGEKAKNSKHTSIKIFMKSFEKYNEIFYMPQ